MTDTARLRVRCPKCAEELLQRAIDLLCGATSGFTPGSERDVEWQSAKAKLLLHYAALMGPQGVPR